MQSRELVIPHLYPRVLFPGTYPLTFVSMYPCIRVPLKTPDPHTLRLNQLKTLPGCKHVAKNLAIYITNPRIFCLPIYLLGICLSVSNRILFF